jgi:CheY-like chemotaxis protein
VQFEVVDTGIGIAVQDMAKLFQPFTQVNDASNRQIGGTGLGLIISKKLIELMGGKIKVSSHPGAGSCFIVELPLQKLGAAEEHTPRRAPLRVMVVSSNYLLANSVAESLAAWGMRGEIVDDSQRALALLAEARAQGEGFHAVIVDSAQPGMSAAGFSADLRHAEEGAHTCLILLAGAEERVRREAGSCPGYDECLSRPAKGSELLAALNAAGVRRPDAFAPAGSGEMGGLRILVVDDHEINRDLITIMLESHGAQVEQATNGAAAVDACASGRYDLILMDINMPGMDGLMATARIRALEAGMRRTPIIALTANAMIDDRQRYLAAGMDDCLVKPPGEKSLQAMVAAHCGPRKVLRQ